MGWGGSNGGSFGDSPWVIGGAPALPPTFPSATISSVEVLATDLLQVNFNVLMKIDGFLSDPSNYTLLDNFSVPMGIRKVVVPIGGTAIFVLLYTDKVVQSLLYTLDILNLRTTKGDTVDLLNSKIEFAGAYTKLDSSRSIQQKMYTKDAGSMLTSLMAAITSEDNKIGG